MSREWSPTDVGELLLGLRTVRQDTLRKIRLNQRKLDGEWTDADEAANPGFRQFLGESLARDQERLEHIAALIPRVKHLSPEYIDNRKQRQQRRVN
jgi:hypothetical protein